MENLNKAFSQITGINTFDIEDLPNKFADADETVKNKIIGHLLWHVQGGKGKKTINDDDVRTAITELFSGSKVKVNHCVIKLSSGSISIPGFDPVEGKENEYDISSLIVDGVFQMPSFNNANITEFEITLPEDTKINMFYHAEWGDTPDCGPDYGPAFYGCSNLTKIVINGGVIDKLSSTAFYNCTALTEIVLPHINNYIIGQSYDGYPMYPFIKFDTANHTGTINDYIITSDGKQCLHTPFVNTDTITIPDGVEEIFDGAVYISMTAEWTILQELTTVNLPSSLKSIGQFNFSGCKNLTNVYIDGVEANEDNFKNAITLGIYAFNNTTFKTNHPELF